MRKKKVLVHGTLDSLHKFFADAVSHDFEIVAILSDDNLSSDLEVFTPKNLPKSFYKLIDGIIFTDNDKSPVNFFLEQGFEPRKVILWDAQGWEYFGVQDRDGTQIIYFCGLEFHIRNADDAKFFNLIVQWLQNQKIFKNLPSQFYPQILARDFQQRTGKPLDLNNLKTFTEKMQWIKLYDATPLKSRLADKYLVRYWVAEKIGDEYLISLLGVWDNFDDINFDALPDKFVLKCNHGSSMNIIVRDKSSFDVQNAREKLNAWLAVDYGCSGLQLYYSHVDRKIIAEKFMANGDLPDLIDYKFLCFNGKIIYCQYLTDRSTNLKLNYFDENWKITNVERSDHPRNDNPEKIPPPKNFELMKKLAATLAKVLLLCALTYTRLKAKFISVK